VDFNLDDEQQMLADTVSRWLDDEYGFDARRRFSSQPHGFEAQNWSRLADLGLLGINVPGEYGGLGGGASETLIVMHAFGRALVVEPYLSTAVVAASLLARYGSEAQKQALLPRIADGTAKLAIASLEPGARYDWHRVQTTAKVQAGGYRLDGSKAVVLHGDSANTLLVSARSSGAVTDTKGISLFLVDANAPGVSIRGFPTIDGQRAAELELRDVSVDRTSLVGAADAGLEILEAGIDAGLAAICAEAVGSMERLMEITAEYLRTRKQFGSAIGSFQAIQHRMADMAIAIEQARAMALCAAAHLQVADAAARRRALSAAKALIGRSGRYVGQESVQLHGGIGMSDELAVGYYFKRLTCIDMTWGDTEYHMERYGELM
jgi:alkylation response protein AidB-like acyl-CoA dehydrogenase